MSTTEKLCNAEIPLCMKRPVTNLQNVFMLSGQVANDVNYFCRNITSSHTHRASRGKPQSLLS